MTVVTTPPYPSSAASTGVPIELIWRLSVEQYHAMIQAGILTEDDPVELLEGWLVTKMPKNPRHSLVTQLAQAALARALPPGWHVRGQEPVTTEDSEPEPDIVVARGDLRQYRDRHPHPQDIALIIEVADSSLQRDRMLKQRLYAAAGIPAYWVVNLLELCIEAHAKPSGPGERPLYHQQRNYGPTEEIPVILDGVESARIAVRDLLP
ncbi:MAG: Uma2 family endonuclease [Candidatus Binatia bacterium]